MTKIKTTHVGSLPRSNELSELLFKKDKKEKIDLENFDAVVKKDVNKIVKKQVDLGIDFISDGEMSKISYATYVKDRIDGFSGESERKAPKDLDDFPTFKERIARSGGTPSYTRPCCTKELKIKDIQDWTSSIYFNVGYNTWNISLEYDLNPLVKNQNTLDGNILNVGFFRLGLIFYML